MPSSIPASTLEKFTTFGDLLRFLRRRVGITQMELATAVGYSDAQISRLEQNLRLPDIPTIEARFVPALDLEDEPKAVARLFELAANVRREDAPVVWACALTKALSYFDEADADLFVGREAFTARLMERVPIADGKRIDRCGCVFWRWLAHRAAANHPWCGLDWCLPCAGIRSLRIGISMCSPPPRIRWKAWR